MPDTNWKCNERAFAKFFSDKLGVEVRRNDAVCNAGDPRRNSDVDVVHRKLQVPKMTGLSNTYEGITGELKYSRTNFKTLYKWLKEHKDPDRPSIIVINGEYFLFWLRDFFPVYNWLVRNNQARSPVTTFLSFAINHKEVKTQFKFLEEGFEQCGRYAHHRNLFPVLCMRGLRESQIVAISLSDIQTLMKRTGRSLCTHPQ